jgi:hypothetical protein
MVETIPPLVRAHAFASTELLLDSWYTVTKYYGLDLETIWIILVIGHETMRPWILDPNLAQQHLSDLRVPDTARGSISRLLIADRTGLPRETVRRRVAELIDRGWVVQDERGHVRTPADNMAAQELQQALEEIGSAVGRYHSRIGEFAAKIDQWKAANGALTVNASTEARSGSQI